MRKQKEILHKENDELKEKVLKLENLLVENKFADLNLNENSPRKTPMKVGKGEWLKSEATEKLFNQKLSLYNLIAYEENQWILFPHAQ